MAVFARLAAQGVHAIFANAVIGHAAIFAILYYAIDTHRPSGTRLLAEALSVYT